MPKLTTTRAVPPNESAQTRGQVRAQPEFARIPVAVMLFDISRSSLYREAGRGNIVMKKAGRTTLVCLASLRAFIAALPAARIRAPRGGKAA